MTMLEVGPSDGSGGGLDVFRDPLPGAEQNPFVRAVDWLLRGIGQVVFQSNWMTGLIILAAIFYNSPVYGAACIAGVVVSTGAALALGADRGLIDAGLFGFNGALVAIGLAAYMSQDFTDGDWPDWRVWLLIAAGAIGTTIAMSAVGALLGPLRTPALTAPFVLTGWLFIFAVLSFAKLEPGPLLAPSVPEATTASGDYTWTTWYQGTFRGVGEIFFQDNWVTGALMALGIAVNTRIGAAMCVGGSLAAVGLAMAYGAPEETIRLGLFGFNAALTAIAIGGFFFVADLRGLAYTAVGVVGTAFAWPALATALAPVGMPTFTAPFVIVTWFMLLAKDGFTSVVNVTPAEATYPEDHLRRWAEQRTSVRRTS